jgi:hypothetical protein
MQKCGTKVEALVSACCESLLPLSGDAGMAIVEKIARGKPLDRLTLGERMQILEALDTAISPKLRKRLPELMGTSRLLGKAGIAMLHELSRIRNDFVHGRWDKENGDRLALDFLTTASELCESRVVAVAVALEEGQA